MHGDNKAGAAVDTSLRKKKILAVSSGEGHCVELIRLSSAFDGHVVVFATVDKTYRSEAGGSAIPGDSAVIFVTVGAQMPFDRLVRAVDQCAKVNGRDDVFAQIVQSDYHPSNMKWTNLLEPDEFKRK